MNGKDLRGEAKELFEGYRAAGYSEVEALDAVLRSGAVRQPELYKALQGFLV